MSWLETSTEEEEDAWLQGAMDLPVSVSLGPMGTVFHQLHSAMDSRDARLKRVKAEIQMLQQGFEGLCTDLKDSSQPEDDKEIIALTGNFWTRQVRDLCYDTSDYLDDVLMQPLHQPVDASGRSSGKRGPKIAKDLSQLIARVEEARKSVEEARETRKRFNLRLAEESTTKPDSGHAGVSHLNPQLSQVQVDIHVNKLIKLLGAFEDHDGDSSNHDDDGTNKKLKVTTIFGYAGVGKTTVARTLFHQYGRKFQCRAFVRVSRDPDMMRLLTNMLSQIKAPLPQAPSDVQGLLASLTKHLQGKRYLIIIDDIWDTATWDIISHALPGGDCCRIIATTQVEDVASACCGYQLKHIYKIIPLNDDQLEKSEGDYTTNHSSEGLKEALKLVYNNLPLHLQTCLLYLNMYPEGYTIRKDELVKQWVAEGFIRAVQGRDMEDVAGGYFDDLVRRGMIQSVDTDHNGKVLSCTLHHMVLDLIRQKSMEEDFVTIVKYFQRTLGLPDKVRRLSVQFGGAKGANTIPENIRKSQVRSLAFSGYFKSVPSLVDYGLLQVFVLHIWADQDKIVDLSSIDELYRLRFLKIECNITVKLPDKIRALQHLGTLQVDGLSNVPSDIVHLEKLQHLRLPSEAILPDEVDGMTYRPTLRYFGLGSNLQDNAMDLSMLASLQDLQLTCSTVKLAENMVANMKYLGLILEKLSNLKSVVLASQVNTSSMHISCDSFSSVSPVTVNLERLELWPRICIFPSLPKWFSALDKLCILKIAVRELSNIDIDILRGLVALTAVSLYIQTAPGLVVFGKAGFSALKYFKVKCSEPWLKFEAGGMPNLRKLKLVFNAKEVQQHGAAPICIEHLPGLKEISAKIGGSVAALSISVSNDPRNPKIIEQRLDWNFCADKDRSMRAMQEQGGEIIEEKGEILEENIFDVPQTQDKYQGEDGSSQPYTHSRISTFMESSSRPPPRRPNRRRELLSMWARDSSPELVSSSPPTSSSSRGPIIRSTIQRVRISPRDRRGAEGPRPPNSLQTSSSPTSKSKPQDLSGRA
ncbi:hypothetical protein BRADI_4g12770v3 [Brachypodium distachyon]|uniref:NB-ARC domain-containing protein n=1 Tax=Brachypodium distachyon TaxID=15368 RepID=A0A0Q3EIV2_BRADI|nr:hypothetical protein BRADI_4g12770v3 [Brachypodium distachyon]